MLDHAAPSTLLPDPATVSITAPLQKSRFRHVSRSAAKRESVQLLGSIEDLQLRFSRAGVVEHCLSSGARLGHVVEEANKVSQESVAPSRGGGEEMGRLWKQVELPRITAGQAKKQAKACVATLRALWDFSFPSSPSTESCRLTPQSPSTRTVLVSTAQAIRKVRALALVISHTAPGSIRISGPPVPARSNLRSSLSTPSRPSGLGQPPPRSVSLSSGPAQKTSLQPGAPQVSDSLGDLRKAALEVLASLRSLEEELRIHEGTEETTDSPDGPTDGSESTLPTSLGSRETYESEEEEYNLNALAQTHGQTEFLQTWEERIVAEARSYRKLGNGEKVDQVGEAVCKWTTVVDRVFGVRDPGSIVEVETWAREEWQGRPWVERLRLFLLANIPTDLHHLLPPPDPADPDGSNKSLLADLLSSLSDGFILTQAFNFAVASSPTPWGFIPAQDIHDTLVAHAPDDAGESGRGQKEWTFRRIGNLTCWAAAVRLRYNIPIHIPSHGSVLAIPLDKPQRRPTPTPVGETTTTTTTTTTLRIEFDPVIVARKGENWDTMLETILTRWIDEAALEMSTSSTVP